MTDPGGSRKAINLQPKFFSYIYAKYLPAVQAGHCTGGGYIKVILHMNLSISEFLFQG